MSITLVHGSLPKTIDQQQRAYAPKSAEFWATVDAVERDRKISRHEAVQVVQSNRGLIAARSATIAPAARRPAPVPAAAAATRTVAAAGHTPIPAPPVAPGFNRDDPVTIERVRQLVDPKAPDAERVIKRCMRQCSTMGGAQELYIRHLITAHHNTSAERFHLMSGPEATARWKAADRLPKRPLTSEHWRGSYSGFRSYVGLVEHLQRQDGGFLAYPDAVKLANQVRSDLRDAWAYSSEPFPAML